MLLLFQSLIKGMQFSFITDCQLDYGFLDLYTHRTLIITLKEEIEKKKYKKTQRIKKKK
jgi:hypothetical protein